MPHFHSHEDGGHRQPRDPEKTHAYLVGGGIASLAAAAYLIHDAGIPPAQIHILESSPLAGGSMDGAGDPDTGYVMRGGRMLNFTYRCLYDLLGTIPSLTDSDISVMDEIKRFNSVKGHKTHSLARIVVDSANEDKFPDFANVDDFGLSWKDRRTLIEMTIESEDKLGSKTIAECFSEDFLKTNFWYMWASMFAFEPWHSAVEFRRYLHRFIHELPRLGTLEGVDRTPYNQYDSIILPMATYLVQQGVEIKYDCKVTGLAYSKSDEITVEGIHIVEGCDTGIIHVHDNDIVIITLGSMTSHSSLGDNVTPAPAVTPADDGSWALWKSVAKDFTVFGNPSNFCTRVEQSHWESFTVTLKTPELLDYLTTWTGNQPGTGALMTFKDSNWLMSIVVPHQPHFINQPKEIQVLWGYGLFPSHKGNYVDKPMIECSGAEILTELLFHLHYPLDHILDNAITIPCSMPYITSQFLTRLPGDRPHVIPKGSTNLAFIGQFVEIPHDVVFTVEYSVRGAHLAVSGLMGLKKQPRKVYRGDHDPRVLARALTTLLDDGVRPFMEVDVSGNSIPTLW